ncbi:MAG TPA: hypothetical protein VFX16_00085 [Pseudonocardiaceae bacterium]|nr:hypothetical protein [Pseudonocardiaceae bacterium]
MSWSDHVISWLNTVLFTVGDDHVTRAERLGFVTGGAGVALTAGW